jgi:hypothetical protein
MRGRPLTVRSTPKCVGLRLLPGDLTEARRLYARNGYQPAAPFNDGWADLWFEKSLAVP